MSELRPAAVLLVLFTLLCGALYPAGVTAIAQMAFARQANGSLITRDGVVVGSELVGQSFDQPGYFWGRPSATGPYAYNGGASTGTNHGPLSPALGDAVKQRIDALQVTDPENPAPIPVDLVTASGSGLDPHVSPAAAVYQVRRVARARNLDSTVVQQLVEAHVEPRTFGVLGEPRVNVLRLNLALDALAGGPPPAS